MMRDIRVWILVLLCLAAGPADATTGSGSVAGPTYADRAGVHGWQVYTPSWSSCLSATPKPSNLNSFVLPGKATGQTIKLTVPTPDGNTLLLITQVNEGAPYSVIALAMPSLTAQWTADLDLPTNGATTFVSYAQVWGSKLVMEMTDNSDQVPIVVAFQLPSGGAPSSQSLPQVPNWNTVWPNPNSQYSGGLDTVSFVRAWLEDSSSNHAVLMVPSLSQIWLVHSATAQPIRKLLDVCSIDPQDYPASLFCAPAWVVGLASNPAMNENMAIVTYMNATTRVNNAGTLTGHIMAYSMVDGTLRWSKPIPGVSGGAVIDYSAGLVYVAAQGIGGPSAMVILTLDAVTGNILNVVPEPTGLATSAADIPLLVLSPDMGTLWVFYKPFSPGFILHTPLLSYSSLAVNRQQPAAASTPGPVIRVATSDNFPGPPANFQASADLVLVDANNVAFMAMADGNTMSVIAYHLPTGEAIWSAALPGPSLLHGGDYSRPQGDVVVSGDGSIVLVELDTVLSLGQVHKSGLELAALILSGIHGGVTVLTLALKQYKKRSGSDGYSSLDESRRTPTDVACLTLTGVLIVTATTIIGIVAQVQAAALVSNLVEPLSDISTFRQEHLEPVCGQTPTSYNLTEMCYCTGLYWPTAPLSEATCSFNGGSVPTCDALLTDTCGCDAAFQEFTCSRRFTVQETCVATYTAVPGGINPLIQQAFSACSEHYLKLRTLTWVLLVVHIVLSLALCALSAVLACRSNDKLDKVKSGVSTVSYITSMILWSCVYSLYSQGAVCTTLPASGSGVTAGSLLGLGIPGCRWTAGTNWPNLETDLLAALNTAVFVHLSKPIMYGIMMLTECCCCCFFSGGGSSHRFS